MGIASSGPVLEDRLYTASSCPLVIVDDPLYISQHCAHRFAKEKSIQYRVGNRTCTIHASAHYENNFCEKISFVLNDYRDGDEVRVDLCVGTEKDSNRSWQFGPITLDWRGPNVAFDQPGKSSISISYGCFLRENLMIIEIDDEERLRVAHSYFVRDRDQCLNFAMGIGCDRRTGLWFTLVRPFEDARNLRTMKDLHSDRVQYLRQGLDSVNNALRLRYALMALQGSTNGLINNLGGTTNGNYNGSFNINNYYRGRCEVRRNRE